MKRIILTGGGTAGHVTPNIALIPKLKSEGFVVDYIGSKEGIERELISACKTPYHTISSGKLRRYLSVKNITDTFRVIKGLGDAASIIKKIKPDIIFSKGGFVSVPVVIAGRLAGVPVVIHESDITPGLANKIAVHFSSSVCVSFPETMGHLPKNKAVLTGSPIRKELFSGDIKKGLNLCGFDGKKPVALIMGGSLGSVKINGVLRNSLDKLLIHFDVVHLCGKSNVDKEINKRGYAQFAYLSDELTDVLACADIIASRAGANSIFEFLALNKPNLLIPLSKKASRGDQILNAMSFGKQGFSKVLYEENLNETSLIENLVDLYNNKEKYIGKMKSSAVNNGVSEVFKVISRNLKK